MKEKISVEKMNEMIQYVKNKGYDIVIEEYKEDLTDCLFSYPEDEKDQVLNAIEEWGHIQEQKQFDEIASKKLYLPQLREKLSKVNKLQLNRIAKRIIYDFDKINKCQSPQDRELAAKSVVLCRWAKDCYDAGIDYNIEINDGSLFIVPIS